MQNFYEGIIHSLQIIKDFFQTKECVNIIFLALIFMIKSRHEKGEHTGSLLRICQQFSAIFNPTNPYNSNPSEDLIQWFCSFRRLVHPR